MSAGFFPLSACPRIVYDLIINNARLYPMNGDASPARQACLAVSGGRIAAIGETGAARETVDANGACLLPGFIDCHTHAVYAGDRSDEHAARLGGASYEEIARGGGGILTTVRAVADASERQLIDGARPRLATLLAEGVTTIEIKSGYGLDLANELKMLRTIRELGATLPMNVVSTFLGAHTIPGNHSHESYMDLVVDEMLPAVAAEDLADAVDIFVENIAFTNADMERLFAAATGHGLKLRAHTEQLSNMGGSARAAELGASSCDHLEHLDEDGVRAMASAGSVAVLLPGAFYFLGETRLPPVAELRKHQVPIAVASDLNPGSSPINSLLACLHMAATLFRLTPGEALLGVTRYAAQALGLDNEIGSLEVGKRADFCLWEISAPELLCYQLGGLRPLAVYKDGQRVIHEQIFMDNLNG
ncbi:MAG: imidazolonepropionase [Gammaproteobacteria bacterium]|nr:imidazolonepropionase [Gammaproteobacteria bacterium]